MVFCGCDCFTIRALGTEMVSAVWFVGPLFVSFDGLFVFYWPVTHQHPPRQLSGGGLRVYVAPLVLGKGCRAPDIKRPGGRWYGRRRRRLGWILPSSISVALSTWSSSVAPLSPRFLAVAPLYFSVHLWLDFVLISAVICVVDSLGRMVSISCDFRVITYFGSVTDLSCAFAAVEWKWIFLLFASSCRRHGVTR